MAKRTLCATSDSRRRSRTDPRRWLRIFWNSLGQGTKKSFSLDDSSLHQSGLSFGLARKIVHGGNARVLCIAAKKTYSHGLHREDERAKVLLGRGRRLDALSATHHFGVVVECFGVDARSRRRTASLESSSSAKAAQESMAYPMLLSIALPLYVTPYTLSEATNFGQDMLGWALG